MIKQCTVLLILGLFIAHKNVRLVNNNSILFTLSEHYDDSTVKYENWF